MPVNMEKDVQMHIEKLEHQNRLMRDALRVIEHVPNDQRQTYTCPRCHTALGAGHQPWCIIGIALGR